MRQPTQTMPGASPSLGFPIFSRSQLFAPSRRPCTGNLASHSGCRTPLGVLPGLLSAFPSATSPSACSSRWRRPKPFDPDIPGMTANGRSSGLRSRAPGVLTSKLGPPPPLESSYSWSLTSLSLPGSRFAPRQDPVDEEGLRAPSDEL